MEFKINIQSQIANRRVKALASGLRQAINGLPGVSYTGQVINDGPAETSACETLLVGVPPSRVPAVLNMVKSHTARPDLGPVMVEIVTEGLKASFEPQVLTHDQLKCLAGALAGP